MRERGLLNGQKWPHFVATRTYDANRARYNQEQEIACAGKGQTGSRHQNGADDKHTPPPDPIGSRCEVEGNYSIAEQR